VEVERAVQLLLAALLPAPASASRLTLERGGTLPLQQQPEQRRAAAALTALLTRSLRSIDPATNYLGGPAAADTSQPLRLGLLCCAVIAPGCGGPPDLVLDAAVARLLELLLLPGAGVGGGSAVVDAVRRDLMAAVAKRPWPLLAAARRVAARMAAAGEGDSGTGGAGAAQALPASISNSAGEQRAVSASLA
jgi:hypothetical protein